MIFKQKGAWFLSLSGGILGLAVVISAARAVEKRDINLNYITTLAQERAQKPFKSPRGQLPEELSQQNLNYDRYRSIRFKSDQVLWSREGLPFGVEFFHPGYIFQEPVQMNEFSLEGYVQSIRFSRDFFDYSQLSDLADKIPVDTGYAGFKIRSGINKPEVMDEWCVFQGASYFRLLGAGQRFGQSARGLALNCGEYEEFPLFTDFWLGRPQEGATQVRVYAILDSRSCTGAYQFTMTPGKTTECDVDAVIFFRSEDNIRAAYAAENLEWKGYRSMGVAPLTSMFWFGENTEHKPDDYRTEVHDSDGLLIQLDGGEVVWRPLNNPPKKDEIRHSVFTAKNPRGFGLLQRDRDYNSYHEIFNLYHKVPSIMVKPKGDWGEGQVRLVEIGTVNEYMDNIVAFWNPQTPPAAMVPFKISYKLQALMDNEAELTHKNYVLSTRVGASLENEKVRQFAIDFTGEELKKIPDNDDKTPPNERVVAVASCSPNAHISENQCKKNPFDQTWKVILKLEPKKGNIDPVSLRCTLQQGDKIITETWDYLWNPR